MTASADLDASEQVSYTIPSGWTQLLASTRSDASSAGTNLQVWYKVANSEPANYAITPDHNNLIGGSIVRITGQDATSPIDVSNVTASLTGEASAPSVTTTVNNTQVFRLVTWDQSKTVNAIPSGHTQAYYVDVSGHDNWGGYKAQATAGSTGVAQFDLSSGSPYVGFTVAIKPAGSTPTPMKLTLGRDALGRTTTKTYTLGDGTTQKADAVTLSQSNQIVSGTELGVSKLYSYDAAGRLTTVTLGTNTYSYAFGTQNTTTCGTGTSTNPNSGKSSNRTTQTVNGVTTNFCYDYADRLTGSSDSLYGSPSYDSHGNMSSIGTGTTPLHLYYDSSDRNWAFEQYTASGTGQGTYYTRDVTGRVAIRTNNSITNWTWANTGDYFYDFTGPEDSPDYVRDANWNITEKYLSLPGGVLLTIRPNQTGNNQKTYSLPNLHSDIFVTTNAAGTLLTTTLTGPYGEPISGQTNPNNTLPGSTLSYVGQHQKLTESQYALYPTEMGARVYLPTLGRFVLSTFALLYTLWCKRVVYRCSRHFLSFLN